MIVFYYFILLVFKKICLVFCIVASWIKGDDFLGYRYAWTLFHYSLIPLWSRFLQGNQKWNDICLVISSLTYCKTVNNYEMCMNYFRYLLLVWFSSPYVWRDKVVSQEAINKSRKEVHSPYFNMWRSPFLTRITQVIKVILKTFTTDLNFYHAFQISGRLYLYIIFS